MSITFQSVRFGAVEITEEEVIDFPSGLIGLGGSRYALLDRNPGSGFLWLHDVDEPALALPVIDPFEFFTAFELRLSDADREATGWTRAAGRAYVTVRAAPDPLDIMVNLRAPIVVVGRSGWQVINVADHAPLQAPLFVASEPQASSPRASAGAA